MTGTPSSSGTARAAMLCAGALLAQQVGSRAVRDAAFLSRFDVTSLPLAMIGSALVSMATVLVVSRWITRHGPAHLMPRALAGGAALLLCIWGLMFSWPRLATALLYVHVSTLGAVLISGFWSLLNECFDPRTAKHQIRRIGTAASLGGLTGGVMSERVGAHVSIHWMLPVLAGLCTIAAIAVLRVRPSAPATAHAPASSEPVTQAMARVFRQAPYLRNLALLVLLTTTGVALLDYVFKSRAAQALDNSAALMRFFAAFYTGAGLLTLGVQTFASGAAMQRLGLARTVATLPAGLATGSLLALAFPGVVTAALARSFEAVLRGSLFRSSYEALFSPVARRDRRATKTLVDVGFERAGDVLGGGLARACLLLPVAASQVMLVVAVLLAAAAFVIARRLRLGYVRELENRLLSGVFRLDALDQHDELTRTVMVQIQQRSQASGSFPVVAPAPTQSADAQLAARIRDLRSSDPQPVSHALQSGPIDDVCAPHVIALLGRDATYPLAAPVLERDADRLAPHLARALRDAETDFTVRRRLPFVMRNSTHPTNIDALLAGLSDTRFEVRFRCGRALAHLHEEHGVQLDAARVYAAVLRETHVDRRVWESHQLLDQFGDTEASFADEYVRTRSNRSLEHVFTLLSLALASKPLQIAFKGLHTDDPHLRGTALEYLDGALPQDVRAALWPFLETGKQGGAPKRSRDEILDALMQSHQSIEINLARLRESGGEPR